ncbi:MAG: radical SAM protein [Methylotetracoccus sp.]
MGPGERGAPPAPPLHLVNASLNRVESTLGKAFLHSLPRYMTIVLGNGCNIDCVHCYQHKNGDNLLRAPEVGDGLRREFLVFYPFLETLRLQGGEVFALRGFESLVEDVAAVAGRPLISVSTNGTLISESWARRIVEMPWQTLTISLDAATPDTFSRLRRGADLGQVLENIERVQSHRRRLRSWYPNLDAFFVVMRSNFREIPAFLDLLRDLEIHEVSFQTMLVDARNLQREPELRAEQFNDPSEVAELHELLRDVVATRGAAFDRIAWSGMRSLFERFGLDAAFLDEASNTLLTDVDRRERRIRRYDKPAPPAWVSPVPEALERLQLEQGLCPNPWSTLFITENGDVSLCFLSEPVGNLIRRRWPASGTRLGRSPSAAGCWRGATRPADVRRYGATGATGASANHRPPRPGRNCGVCSNGSSPNSDRPSGS